MLVLSRKVGEKLIIADVVEVTITDMRGDKVWIGIKAPADIPVDRLEVYLSKQKEKQEGTKDAHAG